MHCKAWRCRRRPRRPAGSRQRISPRTRHLARGRPELRHLLAGEAVDPVSAVDDVAQPAPGPLRRNLDRFGDAVLARAAYPRPKNCNLQSWAFERWNSCAPRLLRCPRSSERTLMTTFLLPDDPVTSLDAYLASEIGGLGIDRAQRLGPAATIDAILASGLRGRGGGGFPTGRKWAGIAAQDRHAPLRRVQRRRGRTGHVQGPRPAAGQPLPARRRRRSSPRSPSAPTRRSSALKRELRARASRPSPGRCRSSSPPASARTARSRSSPDPTSTSSARRRRCSR